MQIRIETIMSHIITGRLRDGRALSIPFREFTSNLVPINSRVKSGRYCIEPGDSIGFNR